MFKLPRRPYSHCKYPKQLCILRSLLMPDLLDIRCLRCILDTGGVWKRSENTQRSIIWFLQIAQLSTTISQAHKATAFHYTCELWRASREYHISRLTFLTSNLFLPSRLASAAPLLDALTAPDPLDFAGAEVPESAISTSAMPMSWARLLGRISVI